jgi:hypothetical protein
LSYFLAGTALAILFSIPLFTAITGGLAAIGIVLWTWALTRYASSFRQTKIYGLNPIKSKFLGAFLQNVFSDFSVFMGIGFYVMTVAYFFTFGQDVLPRIAGYRTIALSTPQNWLTYAYFLLIIFDVDFRITLTLYVCLCLQKRNLMLSRLLENAKTRTGFEKGDLEALTRLDKHIFLIIGSQILFYPISYYDPNLQEVLTLYVAATVLMVAISIIHLKRLEHRHFANMPDQRLAGF